MINAIKTEDNVKLIDIEIKDIKDKKLENAHIILKTNGHDVEINEFTQGILKETIFAVVSSLKIDSEINKINVTVGE